mmetsp:Transcript_22309/g.84653  ORF Transcript_22309/g.84653 Transcript_22309/m.84653 type:complete len:318 (-) Transcript_22309:259-1212(-)
MLREAAPRTLREWLPPVPPARVKRPACARLGLQCKGLLTLRASWCRLGSPRPLAVREPFRGVWPTRCLLRSPQRGTFGPRATRAARIRRPGRVRAGAWTRKPFSLTLPWRSGRCSSGSRTRGVGTRPPGGSRWTGVPSGLWALPQAPRLRGSAVSPARAPSWPCSTRELATRQPAPPTPTRPKAVPTAEALRMRARVVRLATEAEAWARRLAASAAPGATRGAGARRAGSPWPSEAPGQTKARPLTGQGTDRSLLGSSPAGGRVWPGGGPTGSGSEQAGQRRRGASGKGGARPAARTAALRRRWAAPAWPRPPRCCP